MPNPQLSKEQIAKANELLGDIREKLNDLAGSDPELLFAYRRKIAKELGYDERGKPMYRRKIKMAKALEQNGLCAQCRKPLPISHNVLDRITAIGGYTMENTRLLCQPCDIEIQQSRRFS